MCALTLRRLVATCVMAGALLSGCGSQNSYAGAEAAVKDWLIAVENGDPAACTLETPDAHENFAARHPRPGDVGGGCAERVHRMLTLGLPSSDSEMDVPAWDPSGEALVEVTDPGSGTVWGFWLIHEDDRWLIAGQAD